MVLDGRSRDPIEPLTLHPAFASLREMLTHLLPRDHEMNDRLARMA
jgi:hypothetical protein